MILNWSKDTLTIRTVNLKTKRDKEDLARVMNMMALFYGASTTLPLDADLVDEVVLCEGGKVLAITVDSSGDKRGAMFRIKHLA